MNGRTTGKVATNDHQEDGERLEKIAWAQRVPFCGWAGDDISPHPFDLVRRRHRSDDLRQRASEEPASGFGVGGGDPLSEHAMARSLGRSPYEVHHRVDESPGEIASERRREDFAHLHFVPPSRSTTTR
jgi:hypothetical protein